MGKAERLERIEAGLEALDVLTSASESDPAKTLETVSELGAGAIVAKNPELAPLRTRIAKRIGHAIGLVGSLLGLARR
jgi:hypothetical protein